MRLKTVLWAAITFAVLAYLIAPIAVLIYSAFDDGKFFRFPPRELSLRWFREALASPEYRSAVLNSTILFDNRITDMHMVDTRTGRRSYGASLTVKPVLAQ